MTIPTSRRSVLGLAALATPGLAAGRCNNGGCTPGVVERSVAEKLRERLSVKDFGAAGDGKSDDSRAIQTAVDSGAKLIHVPEGIYLVRSTIRLPDDVTLEGASRHGAQILLAPDAANGTDVIRAGQHVTIRNLWIRGNWDGRSRGQRGTGIAAYDDKAKYLHGLTLEDIQIDRCRQYGIHVRDGAYLRWRNVDCNTHGADAAFLEGSTVGSFTSTEIGGESIFSSALGYGLRLKNCLNCRFSFISEYTRGVAFEGNHRALNFDSCYFEVSGSDDQDHIFDVISGGAVGITIQNCFLGMRLRTSVAKFDPHFLSCLFINNVNLTERPYINASTRRGWTVYDSGVLKRVRGGECIIASQYRNIANQGAAETNLFAHDLAGGTVTDDGAGLRLRIWGSSAESARPKVMRVRFGETTVLAASSTAQGKDWCIEVTLLRANARELRAASSGTFGGTPVTKCAVFPADLDRDLPIRVTGQSDSGNQLVLQSAMLELLDHQGDVV